MHVFLLNGFVHISFPPDSDMLENTSWPLRRLRSRWRFGFLLLLLNSDSRGLLLLVGIPGYHIVGSVSVCHYLLVRHRITLVVEVGDTLVFFLS